MALIICPECGQMLSDKAESCPHCGYRNIGNNLGSSVGGSDSTNAPRPNSSTKADLPKQSSMNTFQLKEESTDFWSSEKLRNGLLVADAILACVVLILAIILLCGNCSGIQDKVVDEKIDTLIPIEEDDHGMTMDYTRICEAFTMQLKSNDVVLCECLDDGMAKIFYASYDDYGMIDDTVYGGFGIWVRDLAKQTTTYLHVSEHSSYSLKYRYCNNKLFLISGIGACGSGYLINDELYYIDVRDNSVHYIDNCVESSASFESDRIVAKKGRIINEDEATCSAEFEYDCWDVEYSLFTPDKAYKR